MTNDEHKISTWYISIAGQPKHKHSKQDSHCHHFKLSRYINCTSILYFKCLLDSGIPVRSNVSPDNCGMCTELECCVKPEALTEWWSQYMTTVLGLDNLCFTKPRHGISLFHCIFYIVSASTQICDIIMQSDVTFCPKFWKWEEFSQGHGKVVTTGSKTKRGTVHPFHLCWQVWP